MSLGLYNFYIFGGKEGGMGGGDGNICINVPHHDAVNV